MKSIFKIMVCFTIIVASVSNASAGNWSDNWSINGIGLSKFKNAHVEDYIEFAGGMLTSLVVHWLGHVIILETTNTKWHQDGLLEICDEPRDSNTTEWIGRSGMVTQLLVGGAIKVSNFRSSFFATGYNTWTFIEISTYPIRRPIGNHEIAGDLSLVDRSGNGNVEYIAYTSIAALLMIDINKK